MEIIQKTVALECAKSRDSWKLPTVEESNTTINYGGDYSDWGKLAYDIKFADKGGNLSNFSHYLTSIPYSNLSYSQLHNISKNLPLSTNYNGEKVLRYKTLVGDYKFLIDFIRDSKLYALCRRKDEFKWVEIGTDTTDRREFFFSRNWLFLTELPLIEDMETCSKSYFNSIDTSNCEYGDGYIITSTNNKLVNGGLNSWDGTQWVPYVCINESADKFRGLFRIKGDTTKYEIIYYYFSLYFKNNLLSSTEESILTASPYLNIPILLESEIENIGEDTPYIEDWTANKTYYVGDKVRYVSEDDPLGSVYKLIKGSDTTNVTITEELYNKFKELGTVPLQMRQTNHESPIYSMVVSFYKGYYDKVSKVVYFDDIDSNGNLVLNHWTKCTGVNEDSTGVKITSKTSSQLSALLRTRKSYDDNVELLPFIIADDKVNHSNGEMRYCLGDCCFSISDNKTFCNSLNSIKFYNSTQSIYSPVKTLDESNGLIKISVTDVPTECDLIEFNYVIDKKVDDDGNSIEGTGIIYKEIYQYFISEYLCPCSDVYTEFRWVEYDDEVDDSTLYSNGVVLETPSKSINGKIAAYGGKYYQCQAVFNYVNIIYTNTYSFDADNSEFVTDNGVVAYIEYSDEQANDDDFQDVYSFFDETRIGIANITNDISVNVTRSESAAFERHNILGEVNTFSDLENYRNGLFSL
jgi:hypothetical protein